MQTNQNIIKQSRPLRNKMENERENKKDKQKRERELSRMEKRFFSFV